MAEDYFAHHARNLAGEPVELHNDRPQIGWYRRKRVDSGRWSRVQVHRELINGVDKVLASEDDGEALDARALWQWIMNRPISFEDFKFHREHGHFRDEAPPPRAAVVGDNNPPADEPAALELDDYAKAKAEADRLFDEFKTLFAKGPTADLETARKVQVTLTAAAKAGEVQHDTEMRPWLDGGQKVHDRWSFTKKLREAAALIGSAVITPIMQRQKAAALAEAKAAAEKAAADNPAPRSGTVAPAPPPPVTAAPILRVEGARKIELKEKRTAVVTDAVLCATHFKDNGNLLELLTKLAQKAIDAKNPAPPGVRVDLSEVAK